MTLQSPLSAATITGLFNTATDASDIALAGGNGVTDTHYLVFFSTSAGFAGQQPVTYYDSLCRCRNASWFTRNASGERSTRVLRDLGRA